MWAGIVSGAAMAQTDEHLTQVASFPDAQVTGIGVSRNTGRIFVNFPYWEDPHGLSVGELGANSALTPFPDEAWNAKVGDPAKRFVCVQSVVVDDEDNLWVLDPGSPKMEGVVPGGAKLVKIDLRTNKVVQVIPFDEQIASPKSYLNDVRIDLRRRVAYITESGEGSLVVVDLPSGKARRVLKGSPLTVAEPTEVVVDGIHPTDPKTGKTLTFHADGIAFDQDTGTVYFHPLTGHSLYKVHADDLLNAGLDDAALSQRVTKVGTTPKCDGMLEAKNGRVLLTAIEEDGIAEVDPRTGQTKFLVKDKRLQWPDTMAWGPKETLYVTTSQIHRVPKNNKGVNLRSEPYGVFMLKPGEK